MSTKTSNFEYTKPGVDEFYDVTEYNQTLDQIDADIQARKEAEELKAASGVYGHVKLSDSSAVTDSTGLALPATEKNASIEGTLANQIANFGKSVDLVWSNDGTNFNSVDSYNASQKIVVPKNYDSFIILSTGGTVTHILNVFNTESNIISVLNIEKTIYQLFWAARKVCVDIAVPPTGSSDNYDRCLRFDPCYYRPYEAGGTFTLANGCCVPFRIYGIRK